MRYRKKNTHLDEKAYIWSYSSAHDMDFAHYGEVLAREDRDIDATRRHLEGFCILSLTGELFYSHDGWIIGKLPS